MVSIKEQHQQIAQDYAANRVYQAFERLQIAWYSVNARRPANGPAQFDEAAISELEAAEEEWLAAIMGARPEFIVTVVCNAANGLIMPCSSSILVG